MPIGVGVIGAGVMDADHIKNLSATVHGGYQGTVGMEAWAKDDSNAALDAFRTALTVYAEEKA
ncbi:hypothetical protein [Arthrobacter sp. OY3WO11]|jgi:hydroxypyruvate isomerase|uniref:hypothetical protein n=1 Tax=Arthrobacter sp. OY3WO11 TaxID=1835723 RepID=UPI0007CFE78A|nr:hypothetical protein [Arthrobacter sp. OY3WO11]OAE00873.1 hypothetical protein A6A22_05085 [Arthrobacter sp. OY3WO11]